MSEIKMTTPGEWIVTTIDDGEQIAVVSTNEHGSIQKTIAIFGYTDTQDENENLANAALCAVSKDMLDLLIKIQTSLLDPSVEEIDINEINQDISTILAKLANEAGEEL